MNQWESQAGDTDVSSTQHPRLILHICRLPWLKHYAQNTQTCYKCVFTACNSTLPQLKVSVCASKEIYDIETTGRSFSTVWTQVQSEAQEGTWSGHKQIYTVSCRKK